MSNLSIYIENLDTYHDADHFGMWIALPVSKDEFQEIAHELKIDHDSEILISDFSCKVDNIRIGEFDDLNVVNFLAGKIDNLDEHERKTLESAASYEVLDVYELCDLIDNLDNVVIVEAEDHESLGYELINECYDVDALPDPFNKYIDYEAFGRDCVLSGDWTEVDHGYALTQSIAYSNDPDLSGMKKIR